MKKTWAEKEQEYCNRYSAGRAVTNLWKYIPKNKQEMVDYCDTDCDGYWIWLKDGCTSRDGDIDCGCIHTYTITDIKEDIATIRRKNGKAEED